MKEKITFKVLESTGPTIHSMDPTSAVTFIKDFLQLHTGWLYLNKEEINPEKLTVELLDSAADITITHSIIGG